ncbi:K02A2.6-like [Cordylochernes scorpioides]|uniref:K02A2.6-like n=1 Tax=Cordylochernes scorpioides TaxID=51811 RepID=A0ABY6L5I9_9ARAC|nr:K02A2.6-like [Cordylochernes scorpioides]
MHRHTGPAPSIVVWGGIGYHSRIPLVRIAGTLNSHRYVSEHSKGKQEQNRRQKLVEPSRVFHEYTGVGGKQQPDLLRQQLAWNTRGHGWTESWPKYAGPWRRVHMDYFNFKNKLFLLAVDSFSSWVEVSEVPSTSAYFCINFMRNCIARYGFPQVVVSDNGPPFFSSDFGEFLSKNGISHVTSPPYHPKSNGQAEVSVRERRILEVHFIVHLLSLDSVGDFVEAPKVASTILPRQDHGIWACEGAGLSPGSNVEVMDALACEGARQISGVKKMEVRDAPACEGARQISGVKSGGRGMLWISGNNSTV